MKFFFYLKELHYRAFIIIYCIVINFIILFYYKEQVLYLLGQSQPGPYTYFIATNLTEIFFALLNLNLFLAFYLSYPLIIFQLWFFFKPGLYKYEYESIRTFIKLTIVLFFISTILTYQLFLPYCWKFFSGFELEAKESLLSIHLETRLKDYLGFCVKGLLILNILFHSLLIFIILLKKIKVDLLIYYRKIIYFLIFLAATLGTPPDIFSQVFIGITFICLFESFLILLFILKIYKDKSSILNNKSF
jgi:sec-independent protein translocase protein TatC